MNMQLIGPFPDVGSLRDPTGMVFASDARLMQFLGLGGPGSAHAVECARLLNKRVDGIVVGERAAILEDDAIRTLCLGDGNFLSLPSTPVPGSSVGARLVLREVAMEALGIQDVIFQPIAGRWHEAAGPLQLAQGAMLAHLRVLIAYRGVSLDLTWPNALAVYMLAGDGRFGHHQLHATAGDVVVLPKSGNLQVKSDTPLRMLLFSSPAIERYVSLDGVSGHWLTA